MKVAVVMGSKSDLELVRGALDTLASFGVEHCARVISAHRTPEEAAAFAKQIDADPECKVVICAAGMAAHLGGVLASYTAKPIVAIPVPSAPFGAADALLSIPAGLLLYVSCAPDTLARDLRRLCVPGGYELRSARLFDMFPRTAHFETLCVLARAR